MLGVAVPPETLMFLALGVLLAAARLFGEVAQRFRQPAVLGEIAAGLLLGPTVLGRVAPEAMALLFPTEGDAPVVLQAFTSFAIALFLFVAGMEVDLSTIWRVGRSALAVGVGGIAVPFALGLAGAWWAPELFARQPGAHPLAFATFVAIALSISALPVIVRTLMDLHIYRSDMGMIVVAAAILSDIAGWIGFALVLGWSGGNSDHGHGPAAATALTLGFALFVLTAGRWLLHRGLLWVQATTTGSGGVLGFALVLGLLGAAFTQWAGVHAMFGAFLVGVAIGDSPRLRERTRAILSEFIAFLLAPLFFASIGLRVDFAAHFHLPTVLVVLAIGCAGKLVGCGGAARLCGIPPRESLAIAAALNVRGAMEIVLGLLALQAGIVGERLFVALVVMALATSIAGGPSIQRILHRRKPKRLLDHLAAPAFLPALSSASRREAVRALAHAAAAAARLDPASVDEAAWIREQLAPTGIGEGVAVPHGRIEGLKTPVAAIGIAQGGVDFDAMDGQPARIVVLLLTPAEESTSQIELLADVARTFGDATVRRRALEAQSFLELVAALKEGGNRAD